MRMTERTPDNLVIEEGAGTGIIIGLFGVVIGALGVLIGWINGTTEFLFLAPAFFLFGLSVLLFKKTKTHRFQRWRGMLVIDSKGLWGLERRQLPLDSIAEIVLEERKGRSAPSYYIYYVTKQGERIIWANSYDGSKDDTLACFHAGREFLGLSSVPAGGEPSGTAAAGKI